MNIKNSLRKWMDKNNIRTALKIHGGGGQKRMQILSRSEKLKSING